MHKISHAGNQLVAAYRARLSSAIANLKSINPDAANVHGARRNMKYARAILRLLRRSMPAARYRMEDNAIRAAAHCLNDIRDSEVQLRKLKMIGKAIREAEPDVDLSTLQNDLSMRRRTLMRSTHSFLKVRSILKKSSTQDWKVSDAPESIAKCIRITYRKGRAELRAVLESPTDTRLHALRKQVKYLAYQLETVDYAGWTNGLKQAEGFARLAKLLGDDHDLAILQERISRARLDKKSRQAVSKEIKRRRKRLQQKALTMGIPLYSKKLTVYRK